MKKLDTPHKPEVITPVIEQILKEAASYNQRSWGYRDSENQCGTACCIAGNLTDAMDIPKEIAEKHLGLNHTQQKALFSPDPYLDWPEPWNNSWQLAEDSLEKARVTVDLLEHIRDYGPEAILGK